MPIILYFTDVFDLITHLQQLLGWKINFFIKEFKYTVLIPKKKMNGKNTSRSRVPEKWVIIVALYCWVKIIPVPLMILATLHSLSKIRSPMASNASSFVIYTISRIKDTTTTIPSNTSNLWWRNSRRKAKIFPHSSTMKNVRRARLR